MCLVGTCEVSSKAALFLVERERVDATGPEVAEHVVLGGSSPLFVSHVLLELFEHSALVEDLLAFQLVDECHYLSLALPHVAVVQAVHHQELTVTQDGVESRLEVLEVVDCNQHPSYCQTLGGLIAAAWVEVDELDCV